MQKYPPGAMNLGKVLGKNPGKQGQFTEYKLRVPRNLLKRYNVMKLRAPRPIKFGEIKEANMVRKTKKQVFVEEEGSVMPTHGAGSVYNYERKEEARKKRKGYIKKTVNTDDLPYALRLGGKGGKRYTGKKEPILEHSSYYILTQCPDGVFEAVPVQAWYNFMPDINYSTLSIEEVDNEFSKRDRSLSYFTKKYNFYDDDMMMSGDFREKVQHTNRDHGLLIHDDLDMDDDDAPEEESEEEKPTKKQSKKEKDLFRGKKKAKPTGSDIDSDEEEELENFDSKEVDYMSESSSEDELLEMDDEPDPEKDNAGKPKDDLNLFTDSEDEEEQEALNAAGKELKAILKKETGTESSEEDVDDDEEEEDEDIDNEYTHSAVFLQGKDKKKKGRSGSSSSSKPNSRSNTPIQLEQATDTISQAANSLKEGKAGLKRSHDNSSPSPQSKKQKLSALAGATVRTESPIPAIETFRTNSPALRPSTPSDSGNGITEESIRRYLTHKPMTTTDLMRKFKTKKTGLSKEQTVNAIATILKKIQLHQEKIDGKLYLSIKPKK